VYSRTCTDRGREREGGRERAHLTGSGGEGEGGRDATFLG